MEEKINNKRIFSYVPSTIAKVILESELKDEDVFFKKNRNIRNTRTIISPSSTRTSKYNKMFDRHSTVQTNPEVFPIEYPLAHSIIMSVKLKGFQDLILSLGLNDKNKQKLKLHCEYLPILTSKILLQMSSIITENGGEILKLDDFEFYAIWDFSNIDIKNLHQYQYFYSKHAIISAYDIMKKVNDTEIIKGYKIKVSIGIAYGETSIFFFGGERRRSDFVLMGETVEESEHCLTQCGPQEIIIGREINNIFKGRGEIATEQVGTDEKNKNIYKLDLENTDEYELKNFQSFRNIKLNSNYIVMNQKIYEKKKKKVYILSSVLPQGLVKYLDIGEDANLKEISIITIMTVHIIMDLDLIDNSSQIQDLIKDMQKATYLTRGSLLGVIKTFNGLMVKCVWGLEPNTFIDEPARAISTAFCLKKLTNNYKIKIGIGIATGGCFTGLINIQGNRKMYSILGYKAIISRLLADKANRLNMKNKNDIITNRELDNGKFVVYCDKATVKHSQKWYRHNFVNDLLHMFHDSNIDDNSNNSPKKTLNQQKSKNLSQKKDTFKKEKKEKDSNRTKSVDNNSKKKNKNDKNNKSEETNTNKNKKNENNMIKKIKKKIKKIGEIYIPIEYDEYFFQTTLDPFPLIRTYKYNSHNRNQNDYKCDCYLNKHLKADNSKKDIYTINIISSKNTCEYINNIKNIKLINKDDSINDFKTRLASRTMYVKRTPVKDEKLQDFPINKNSAKKLNPNNNLVRIDSRFDSINLKPIKKKVRKDKNLYAIINRLNSNKNNTKDENSYIKLKKSQTIIGLHYKISKLIDNMNDLLTNNKKQFYLIRGPLGVGKSLFIRKVLNNFIALNDTLGKNYFNQKFQFLFCNLLNPFTTILPYNTISFIFRKIFLLLRLNNKKMDIYSIFTKLSLDNQTVNNISFILSLGRGDINLLNEYLRYKKPKKSKIIPKKISVDSDFIKKNGESLIKEYEGPFNYENIDLINSFFYEMIILYQNFLFSLTNINNFILPLIFLLDDIQLSDKFSISFIEFLFKKIRNDKNNDLNGFIFIMIQQTPFTEKYRGINPIDLDIFLNKYITFNINENNVNKIICFEIKPIYDENILKKIIIFHFKNSVFKHYGTELNVVDNQILDFLLTKSFNGIPFLVVNLLKSLIDSDKFIQILSGELIITSELKDESDIMDWNDIIIPYIYEKIASNSINKLLNFKEILILKYASIIGTIFDIKTLDKINPLNSIIKIEDIINLSEKLTKEYFAELHNENQIKKNKLICQITFPFLREVLYQKFLIETRARLHMKLAGIISMSKRIIYFSLDDEIKLLKKHLFNSEINIINELKSYKNENEIKTIKDILQSKKDLSFNNLKILLIKEICHNFYRNQIDNLLDGNLEMYNSSKSNWIRIYYLINTRKIIFYNQYDENKEKQERHPILMIGLNSIYRNDLSINFNNKTKNNILEMFVSEEGLSWTKGLPFPRKKKKYYFSSEKIKDIYRLEIGINFLKMKVNYDTFTSNFGSARFPLYKLKWFVKKEEKYFFDSENSFNLWNIKKDRNKNEKKKSNLVSVEKLIDKSQGCQKPFYMIMNSALGLFFGLIQEKIRICGTSHKENNNNYLYVETPNHFKQSLNKLFYFDSFINKRNNNSSFSEKINDLNKSNYSLSRNIDDFMDNNSKSMKNNNNNLSNYNRSNNESFVSSKSSNFNKIKNENTNPRNILKEPSIKINDSLVKKETTKPKNESLVFDNISIKNSKRKNNKKHVEFEKYINIPKISFPKNPSLQVNKKEFDEEEPLFSESNLNTSRNISMINANDNDSTKLSFSSNKRSIKTDIINITDSIKEKKEICLESLNDADINYKKTLRNKRTKQKRDSTDINEINFNKIINFEDKKKLRKSRNINTFGLKKKKLNSYDNKYEEKMRENEHNNLSKEKNKKPIELCSFDDIYKKRIKLPGDFVPFKSKEELKTKHVNVVSSDDSFEEPKIIKVYPSINFNDIKSSQILKYITLGDDPKYMYVDYYHNNHKIHKSKLLTSIRK